MRPFHCEAGTRHPYRTRALDAKVFERTESVQQWGRRPPGNCL